jgi:hypothetical protein
MRPSPEERARKSEAGLKEVSRSRMVARAGAMARESRMVAAAAGGEARRRVYAAAAARRARVLVRASGRSQVARSSVSGCIYLGPTETG